MSFQLQRTRQKQVISTKNAITPASATSGLEQIHSETIVDQVITQVQSLKLIKDLLACSFSSIFWVRGLLPDDAFAIQNIFDNSTDRANRRHEQVSGRRIMIVGGATGTADRILSALDDMMDPIRKGYLGAINVSISIDEENDDHVVESYTFTMRYAVDEATGEKNATGMTIEGCGPTKITVRDAQAGVLGLTSQLVNVLTTLPVLPEPRIIHIHLSFNPDCPLSYVAPGYIPTKLQPMLLPEGPWIPTRTDIGNVDIGYHESQASIVHIIPTEPEAYGREDIIPRNLRYTRSIPRFHHLYRDSVYADDHVPLASNAGPEYDQIPPLSAAIQQTQVLASTQQQFLQPPILQAGISDTQSLYSSSHQQRMVWVLSEIVANQLFVKSRFGNSSRETGEVTTCECGHHEEEGAMAQCDFCVEWKHLDCYGLQNANIKAGFVCYSCLFQCTETLQLEAITQLARQRRVLSQLRSAEWPETIVQLSKVLVYPEKSTGNLIKSLKVLGVLEIDPHRQSSSQRPPLSMYRINDRVADEMFELGQPFHPLAQIQHLYVKVPFQQALAIPSKLQTQSFADYSLGDPVASQQLSILGQSQTIRQDTPALRSFRDGSTTEAITEDMSNGPQPVEPIHGSQSSVEGPVRRSSRQIGKTTTNHMDANVKMNGPFRYAQIVDSEAQSSGRLGSPRGTKRAAAGEADHIHRRKVVCSPANIARY
ncbi:DNA binding protein [Agyrium rufum]|nr:DNA binding protein [Agyrium rufum]